MNARTWWFQLALSGIALLIASGLAAAPRVSGGMGVDPSPDALALLRDQVYTAAKELGAPPDVLGPALARIVEQASVRQIDMASIHDVTATIADFDMAMKAEAHLVGFAETAARAAIKLDRLGAIDRDPGGGLRPLNGGSCRACTDGTIPAPGFGPLAPSSAWQFHSESTDAAYDCNWYVFNVIVGNQYQFTTCGPGSATFDTILGLYSNPACVLQATNDDSCSSVASSLIWTSNVTGTIKLKVSGHLTQFGPYTLGYRTIDCSTCQAPITTLTPTTTCQIASGSVNATCPDLFYAVNLVAGSSYEFTTCPADCSATSCTTVADTVLELYRSPGLTCSVAERVAFSDDIGSSCSGLQFRSRIRYTALVTGVHRINAHAFSSATSGTICMGFRVTTGGGCPNNCTTGPFVATITPTAACQTHASFIVPPCADTWYIVNATAAGAYEFTTCGGPSCSGGNSAFDSIIQFYNNSCTLLASDDDSCGAPRSHLTVTVTSPGTYRLRMGSHSGGGGPYTLIYRSVGVACAPPSNVTSRPLSGNTGATNCSVSQTFGVTSLGTWPMSYTYVITPPAGGAAAPASGAFVGGVGATNPGSFTSTLTPEGAFPVYVTATNACGSSTSAITYTLRDLVAPRFLAFPANTTVLCTLVPPVPTLVATDNCDPDPVETFSSVTIPGSCPGRYTIARTWTARDRAGNISAPRTQTINVVDITPPVIVPDTSVKYCIYPPDHRLVCFLKSQFSPVITDDCSPPLTWKFIGILNSEEALGPCGAGNIDPDWIINPAGDGFCVRSERCGQDPSLNDGRIYLLLTTATDACGNTSAPTPVGAILVPHDSGDTSNCIFP